MSSTEIRILGEDNMPKIKDSGQRTVFDTGAIREIDETKGRCDLVFNTAWGVVAEDDFYSYVENFVRWGDLSDIMCAIRHVVKHYYNNDFETAYLDVSKHYAEGCRKYGERNMEKGLPWHSCVDSALRHYTKLKRGDVDEPHNRAVLWNLLTLSYYVSYVPQMNDLPFKGE